MKENSDFWDIDKHKLGKSGELEHKYEQSLTHLVTLPPTMQSENFSKIFVKDINVQLDKHLLIFESDKEITRFKRIMRQFWSYYSIARKDALYRQRRKKALGKFKNGRTKYVNMWECECCDKYFAKGEVQVDHIFPVGSLVSGEMGRVLEYMQRLFCASNGLQVLCKKCHKSKTVNDIELINKKRYSYDQLKLDIEVL